METPLTLTEQNELTRLESVIQKNLQSFYEVGMALMKIRDSKFYRLTNKTFQDYCEQRWSYTANYARRLIESSLTIENIKSVPIGTIPTSESQTRPLSHLPPKQQREAWKKAVETAPKGRITAKHIENVAKEFNPRKSSSPIDRFHKRASAIKKDKPEDLVSDEFREAFNAFLTEIKNAKALKWRTTSKEAALQHIKILYDVITISYS